MLYSVQTGKSGVEKSLGMPMFDWLAMNPEEVSLFSETMIGVHGSEPPAVAAAYDFSGSTTIVDVGGATGHLLTTILGSYPAHAASSLTFRMSLARLPHWLIRAVWPSASQSRRAVSSRGFQAVAMPIFFHTSSTTGAKSSA